jgi:hypothetical protein
MGSDECSFSEKMVGPGSFSENALILFVYFLSIVRTRWLMYLVLM